MQWSLLVLNKSTLLVFTVTSLAQRGKKSPVQNRNSCIWLTLFNTLFSAQGFNYWKIWAVIQIVIPIEYNSEQDNSLLLCFIQLILYNIFLKQMKTYNVFRLHNHYYHSQHNIWLSKTLPTSHYNKFLL